MRGVGVWGMNPTPWLGRPLYVSALLHFCFSKFDLADRKDLLRDRNHFISMKEIGVKRGLSAVRWLLRGDVLL